LVFVKSNTPRRDGKLFRQLANCELMGWDG